MRPLIQIYSHFDVSGIQTQMLFLANEQARLGGASIIYSRKGGLEKFLDDRVMFIEYEDYDKYVFNIVDLIDRENLTNPIIWASHPFDLSKLYQISLKLRRKGISCSVTCGVYHPRACFKPEDSRFTEAICRLNIRSADAHNVYFMSNSVLESHARRWPRLKKDLNVIPVVFPRKQETYNFDCSQKMVIVSIGRLVPWKAYNLSLVKASKRLKDSGVMFEWSAYGDGELFDKLNEEVQSEGLSDVLSFRGGLNFGCIDSALDQVDLFVGMGTSMLEAALRGIPCIVAVDGEKEKTYGFLFEVPIGNIGELMETPPNQYIVDKILEFSRMTKCQRQAVSEKCRDAALSQTSSPTDVIQYFQRMPSESIDAKTKKLAVIVIKVYVALKKLKSFTVSCIGLSAGVLRGSSR